MTPPPSQAPIDDIELLTLVVSSNVDLGVHYSAALRDMLMGHGALNYAATMLTAQIPRLGDAFKRLGSLSEHTQKSLDDCHTALAHPLGSILRAITPKVTYPVGSQQADVDIFRLTAGRRIAALDIAVATFTQALHETCQHVAGLLIDTETAHTTAARAVESRTTFAAEFAAIKHLPGMPDLAALASEQADWQSQIVTTLAHVQKLQGELAGCLVPASGGSFAAMAKCWADRMANTAAVWENKKAAIDAAAPHMQALLGLGQTQQATA